MAHIPLGRLPVIRYTSRLILLLGVLHLAQRTSCKHAHLEKVPIYFVPSDAKPGYIVATLDVAPSESPKIVHEKGGKNLKPWFSIHKPGRLVVKKRLTEFRGDYLELHIEHKSENYVPRREKIIVSVTDVDNIYDFTHQPYTGSITENLPPGTVVDNLDPLFEDLRKFPYACTIALLDGPSAFFKVKGWPSKLRIVSTIDFDRERQPFVSFTLQADCLTSAHRARITVNILDANDNAPQFDSNLYHASLTATDLAQHIFTSCIVQVHASDADSTDRVTYVMPESKLFALDELSGCVSIKSDHIQKYSKSYEIIVTSKDEAGHESNRAVVRIDVDAHTPSIAQHPASQHRTKRNIHPSPDGAVYIASTRPMMTFVVRKSEVGQLFTLADEDSEANEERFQFMDPEPEGLEIAFLTGIVSLENGHTWNSTTEVLTFSVNITRDNDSEFMDDQPVTMHLVDRAENDPIFTNLPRPMWATIPVWIRPDRVFYTTQAIDSQAPYNASVVYVLEAGGDGCFSIDAVSGDVTVACRQEFILGMTYELSLSAEVVGTVQKITTPVQVLSIRVGEMDPMFYEDYTDVMMPETLPVGGVVVALRGMSFVGLDITYTLVEQDQVSQGVFTLQSNGDVTLNEARVYISDPHQYRLVVNLTEAFTGKQQSADVIITLEGENLNTPFFPGTVYPRRNVPEDEPVGNTVISVTAVDLDQGQNGEMTFTVSDSHFRVMATNGGKVAEISVNEELDYDLQPRHLYDFTLTAADMGTPTRTGTTRVQVWVTDVSDEAPVMDPPVQEVRVNQDATAGTRIHIVQAYDPDVNDVLSFTFGDGSNVNGPYDLHSVTGAITLNREMLQGDPSNLTISVTGGGMTTQGVVLIQSIGVNHPPDFSSCYNIIGPVSVLENQPIGTSVYNVTLFEEDTGVNGDLDVTFQYNFATEEQLFDIGHIENLGGGNYQVELVTAVVFDREDPEKDVYYVDGRQSYKATILAEDNGTPQLGATCFFFVEIADENDNRPRFDENPAYQVIMMDSLAQGERVVRVFAVDDDSGTNAVFTYVMTEDPTCSNCFVIDANTGWITRGTGSLGSVVGDVLLEVTGDDNGMLGETVGVNIQITNNLDDLPPAWIQNIDDLPPVQIMENVSVSYTSPDLSFDTDEEGILSLLQGRTPQENSARDFWFTETNGGTRINILTAARLDYEVVTEYILRVRASALDAGQTGPFNDARLRVDLIDVNDKIPEFVGLVDETGSYPAAVSDQTGLNDVVVKVTAVDQDTSSQHNTITYSFSCQGNLTDCDAFTIESDTGIIRTARADFNPSVQPEFFVRVRARDSSPAEDDDQPYEVFITVRIVVTGTSINPPYFEENFYTATMDSGAQIGTNVTTIVATDPLLGGNVMQYVLVDGNEARRFAVDRSTGVVFTTTEILYEQQQQYNITYGVFDGVDTYTTMLYITVSARNVYPPSLPDEYNSVPFSEVDVFTPGNPITLATVSATDPEGITTFAYSLEGAYVVNNRFRILSSGDVLLQDQLDRDYPGGTDNWLITVVASDQDADPTAQRGYAVLDVRPDDVNDNAPIFDVCCLEGNVTEGSPVGTDVLQLVATDYDTGVNAQLTYGKVMFPESQPGTDLFRITTGGLIETNVDGSFFNREVTDRYEAVVYVEDAGTPRMRTNQTVDIIVNDANEFPPDFVPATYSFVIDEELPVGASVGAVFAQDQDANPDPQLVFAIINSPVAESYFYVDSIFQGMAGVIRIEQQIDYEDGNDPKDFQFQVRVTDSGGLTDTADVRVTVRNVNDHAPVLVPATDTVDIAENTLTITPEKSFSATDEDNPSESIYFRIDYESSDPDKKFWINPTSGVVSLVGTLDRETVDSYVLIILGIDQGNPAMTGTATLNVTVTDENDNAPTIITVDPEFPVVGAGTNTGAIVAVITIEDPDVTGGPLTMAYCNDVFCQDFDFAFDGTNTGTLRAALNGYSRADLGRAFYDLDFELGDSSGNTVIETVRVYVRSTNSQSHEPGLSHILVYNYKGLLPDTEIGRVYCEDSDDWDLADKTFAVTGDIDSAFFLVDSEEGRITIKKGAPRGDYTLDVDVSDSVYGNTVTCTTTVTVVYLFDDAITSTGSVRFSGISAEMFIEREQDVDGNLLDSMYTQFKNQLVVLLGTTAELVHLYTVRDTGDGDLDVFIAAEGLAGYFRPSKINGIIWVNKEQLNTQPSLTVVFAPINLCMDDSCFGTGCTTIIDTVADGLAVFTNQTSLMGLGTSVSQQCVCAATNYTEAVPMCEVNTCANDGVCEEYYNGYSCVCEDDFDGPNCEQTKLHFSGGSWAWYDHLPACDHLNVRFQFMTDQTNAVLLYNGPMFDEANTVTRDYLAIEITNGYPRAMLNVGNGEIGMTLDGRDSNGVTVLDPLNDGEWHTIEYYMSPGYLRLTVDHCRVAYVNETIDSTLEDRRPCERTTSFPPAVNHLLNVFTPLELGGRYNTGVDRPVFTPSNQMQGCMKEIWINGELLDLHVGGVGESLETVDGCPDEGCGACPNNSVCVGNLLGGNPVCRCLPGYYGDDCILAPVADFTDDTSYIEWGLFPNFNNSRHIKDSEIQLQFRTRQEQGTIFYTDSFSTLERSILEIADTNLQFRYDLGAGDRLLSIPMVNVSDGEWHTVRVQRFGTQVILMLDHSQGKFHAEANPVDDFRTLVVSGEGLTGGAYIERNLYSGVVTVYDPLPQSCIRDVRMDQETFPVTSVQPSDVAEITNVNLVLDTCESDACAGITCPFGFCLDVWREHMCVCPDGEMDNGAGLCVPIVDCSLDPCVNGDCVMVEDPEDPDGPEVWRCNCYFGWAGTYCNETVVTTAPYLATVSTGWIIAVMCAFILLLIIVLIVVCCTKKRKAGLLDEPFDAREMFKDYDEEGAGEDDMHAYDLKPLQKPYEVPRAIEVVRPPDIIELPKAAPEPMHQGRAPFEMPADIRDIRDLPNVGKFIIGRLGDADGDPGAPPFDSVREYEYEGAGSSAGSLSSIQTSSSGGDQDFDYLLGLGAPFRKLADLYIGSDERGSDDDSDVHQPRKLVLVGAGGQNAGSLRRGVSTSDSHLPHSLAEDAAHHRALSQSDGNMTKGILRNADSRRSFTGQDEDGTDEGRRGILKRSSDYGELSAVGFAGGRVEFEGPERAQYAADQSSRNARDDSRELEYASLQAGGQDSSKEFGYATLQASGPGGSAHMGYASMQAGSGGQGSSVQAGAVHVGATGGTQQSQNVRVVTTTVTRHTTHSEHQDGNRGHGVSSGVPQPLTGERSPPVALSSGNFDSVNLNTPPFYGEPEQPQPMYPSHDPYADGGYVNKQTRVVTTQNRAWGNQDRVSSYDEYGDV